MSDPDLGRALLTIARNAIAAEFGRCVDGSPSHEALAQPAATFVTLFHGGELRGCIGSLKAKRALLVDVHENAVAAAFRDPRFPPLTAEQFDGTAVEVSLLSASERLQVADEEELLMQLRPGIDGLTIEYGRGRATFLPQVWDGLPDPRVFLAALRSKAGLPADFWSPRLKVSRYAVTKWSERALLAEATQP